MTSNINIEQEIQSISDLLTPVERELSWQFRAKQIIPSSGSHPTYSDREPYASQPLIQEQNSLEQRLQFVLNLRLRLDGSFPTLTVLENSLGIRYSDEDSPDMPAEILDKELQLSVTAEGEQEFELQGIDSKKLIHDLSRMYSPTPFAEISNVKITNLALFRTSRISYTGGLGNGYEMTNMVPEECAAYGNVKPEKVSKREVTPDGSQVYRVYFTHQDSGDAVLIRQSPIKLGASYQEKFSVTIGTQGISFSHFTGRPEDDITYNFGLDDLRNDPSALQQLEKTIGSPSAFLQEFARPSLYVPSKSPLDLVKSNLAKR